MNNDGARDCAPHHPRKTTSVYSGVFLYSKTILPQLSEAAAFMSKMCISVGKSTIAGLVLKSLETLRRVRLWR